MSPPGKVGDEHVLAKVKLGLHEDAPATRPARTARRAPEGPDEVRSQHGRCERVARGRTRGDHEFAIKDLANLLGWETAEIIVGGARSSSLWTGHRGSSRK